VLGGKIGLTGTLRGLRRGKGSWRKPGYLGGLGLVCRHCLRLLVGRIGVLLSDGLLGLVLGRLLGLAQV